MRVALQADALADSGNWKNLDDIIRRIDKGAHEWEVDDPDVIEGSDWLGGSRHYIRELFEHAAKQGSYPQQGRKLHLKRVSVTCQPVSKQELQLSPVQASAYLEKPLTILVENRFSDELFGTTILDFLGSPELNDFRKRVPQALAFDGGGGNGELPKVLDRCLESAQADDHPVRAVVFTDSDGLTPGNRSNNALLVEKKCKEKSVPCHLLQKRAIENYIPDEIFQAWASQPDGKKKVDALLRMTPEQRDHFPLKKGFNGITPENKIFYATVSDGDKVILDKCFVREPIELLEKHREKLTKNGLQKRDGNGELERLVAMIVGEI